MLLRLGSCRRQGRGACRSRLLLAQRITIGCLAVALAFNAATPFITPEPTPDAVDKAIKNTPADALGAKLSAAEAEAQAKWPALAEISKAEAEAQAKALAETNETMRIEAVSGDALQRWWRPIYAFELTLECAVCWALALWDLAFGTGKIAAWAVNASGLLSVYWGARFGVLGVYVNGRSREKEAALTGQPAPTAINSLVKTATRKLRR